MPTDSLFDDEYYIAVKGENSLGEESKPFFATGTYLIDRSEKELLPPLDLLVSERESFESSKVGKDLLSLFAVWKNSNGKRTAGYKVKLETITGTDEINVGNVTEFRFSNYEIGTKLSFSVC